MVAMVSKAFVLSSALLFFGASASAEHSDATSVVQTQIQKQDQIAEKPLLSLLMKTVLAKDVPIDEAFHKAAAGNKPATLAKDESQGVGLNLIECMGCIGCLWQASASSTECREGSTFEGANQDTCLKNRGKWCTGSSVVSGNVDDPGTPERLGAGGRVPTDQAPVVATFPFAPPPANPAPFAADSDANANKCGTNDWSFADADSWSLAGCEGCGVLGRQSPVDLDPTVLGDDRNADFADATMKLPYNFQSGGEHAVLFNDGNSLRVNLAKADFGVLTLGGADYKVKELNWVFPSEHKVSNVSAAGELQVVLRKRAGESVIISIFLEEGEDAEANLFSQFRHSVAGTSVDGSEMLTDKINLGLLGQQLDGKYWSYMGSTSQPPCSPALRFIMARPASVSKAVLDDFRGVFANNARPVQPLGGRAVRAPASFNAGQ